jgi:hypothetical protein
VSATGLFIVGVLVTLLVAGAMALLVYAAILDGRAPARRETPTARAGVSARPEREAPIPHSP